MNDGIEEELFSIKSKFLREIPHPKLILKAIDQTKKLISDFNSTRESEHLIQLPDKVFENNLKNSLMQHSDFLLQLKLKISQAQLPGELYIALNELYFIHSSMIKQLSTYLPELESYPDSAIKISDSFDSYALSRFIETAQLNENEIKAYICNSILNKPALNFDMLTIACLRSKKIIEHAGSV